MVPDPTKKMVPPDGGWGWIVVLGVSIVNLCSRSIETSFGLLFGETLKQLGVETTGAAVIMSTLDALINFSGLFVGPLINAYGYRKISIIGGSLVGIGFILTSPASSMGHILATYSIINGIGVGLASSATFVSLNHYFVKRRGQAVGFSMAGTAVGMLFMPHIVSYLLDEYAFQGTVLILGSLMLHSLPGAFLLQPAQWHFVPEKIEEDKHHQEMETIKETEDEENDDEDSNTNTQTKTLIVPPPRSPIPEGLMQQKMAFLDVEKHASGGLGGGLGLTRKGTFPRNFSTMSFTPRRRKDSMLSTYSSMDFTGSSMQMHLQTNDTELSIPMITHNAKQDGVPMRRNLSYPGILHANQLSHTNKLHIRELPKDSPIHFAPKKAQTVSIWKKIVEFMDLDLLSDPVYLNLVLGLSLFYVAEQNFKMVVPFFFTSIGYTRKEISMFLSVQATTDILARLILPPLCDRLSVTRRTMFFSAIGFLALTRSVLAEQTEYVPILVWLTICGFVRGAALINFTITISEYSTLEKLPAAFGLHMVAKGIFVVALGPLLGVIRDQTQSYPVCLHSQSFLIAMCCLAWSIEYLLVWFRPKKQIVVIEIEET